MATYHVSPNGKVTDDAGNERPDIAAKAGNLLPNDHRGQDPARVQDLRKSANEAARAKGKEEPFSKDRKGKMS